MAKHQSPHDVAPLMILPNVIRFIIVPARLSGSQIIVIPPRKQKATTPIRTAGMRSGVITLGAMAVALSTKVWR